MKENAQVSPNCSNISIKTPSRKGAGSSRYFLHKILNGHVALPAKSVHLTFSSKPSRGNKNKHKTLNQGLTPQNSKDYLCTLPFLTVTLCHILWLSLAQQIHSSAGLLRCLKAQSHRFDSIRLLTINIQIQMSDMGPQCSAAHPESSASKPFPIVRVAKHTSDDTG